LNAIERHCICAIFFLPNGNRFLRYIKICSSRKFCWDLSEKVIKSTLLQDEFDKRNGPTTQYSFSFGHLWVLKLFWAWYVPCKGMFNQKHIPIAKWRARLRKFASCPALARSRLMSSDRNWLWHWSIGWPFELQPPGRRRGSWMLCVLNHAFLAKGE